MTRELYTMLKTSAEADFYKNAEEALVTLVDADDRLSALEKYFKEE